MIRYLLSLFILLGPSLSAQNFNYTVSTTTETWQELNSQTILNANNSAWNFSYKIPVGFPFTFLGRNFDSLTIETNGYLVFDEDRNYALTTFLGFSDCEDSSGTHAVLGYELSGTTGNRILKIQFKNTGVSRRATKFFSWQIWLKESGVIEVHIGPNDFQPSIIVFTDTSSVEALLPDAEGQANDSLVIMRDTTFINYDSLQAYRVGLLNMNMDTPTRGLFIGGTIDSPQSRPVDENNSEPIYFMRAPSPNTRYTFTPNSN
jgi:hypothetical protein